MVVAEEIFNSSYTKDLPNNSIDVSDIVERKINVEYLNSTNEYVKGLNGTPAVFYSLPQDEFYVKKGQYYKILRWRTQKVKGLKNSPYSYEYILIPYKRRQPIKILRSFWLRNFNTPG
jgi:hypothetical protein